MSARRHGAGVAAALVLGAALTGALAVAQAPVATTAGTTPTTPAVQTVAEQVSTARQVVPFGVTHDGGASTVWATGRTRAPGLEPPSTPQHALPARPSEPIAKPAAAAARLARRMGIVATSPPAVPTTPQATTPAATTPAGPPPESTPPGDTVLLQGTTADAADPTAWKRADPPVGTDGTTPLSSTDWRAAGGDASLHAGEATPRGAAGLLVSLGAADAQAHTPGILSRRADGHFQQVPDPPAALLAPATTLFEPDSKVEPAPFAVVDVPSPPVPGSTTPPPFAGTGLLLAPPKANGILAWNGTAWTKDSYADAAGDPITTPRTAAALAATPDGDGVALLSGDPAGPDRVRLYRRAADHAVWREITIRGAPLLSGALPAGIVGVRPTRWPGDPLTVATGHWWLDLVVETVDSANVHTDVDVTIHLVPGKDGDLVPSPTTPEPTTPEPTDPGTGATTPAGTDPTTPGSDPTTPASTPAPASFSAAATGTWCEPSTTSDTVADALPGGLCEHELPTGFPTLRGYRSQAFAGSGFGGRVITSPVDATTGTEAQKEASTSGGYLSLTADRFELRSGVGDRGDGLSETEAGAFDSAEVGWIGGKRTVGHVMPPPDVVNAATASSTAAPPRGGLVDDGGWQAEGLIAAALSPDGVDPADAGMITLSSGLQLRRVYSSASGKASGQVSDSLLNSSRENDDRTAYPIPRALAWPRPQLIVAAGSDGMLRQAATPEPSGLFGGFSSSPGDGQTIEAAAGLDLTALAFTREGPLDGWAVGRDGAAVRCRDGAWTPVRLPGTLATADLRQIAYAGNTALVASSAGPLVERGGNFAIDTQLAAMIAADGRPAGVRTVAALPDGAAVYDARYIRDSATADWRRLNSPAEGDVVAVGLARGPGLGAGTLGPLRLLASIADVVPPRRGPYPSFSGVSPSDAATLRLTELAPVATDGRLAELTDDGWIDRIRTPLDDGRNRDLAAPALPTQAIALRPDGTGWAVGGLGAYLNLETLVTAPRGTILPFTFDLDPPASLGGSVDGATEAGVTGKPAAGAGAAGKRSSARAAVGTRAARQQTPIEAPAPAGEVRILVGGHPACLDSCAGRDDQGVAPTQTLREALHIAARLSDDPEQAASALIIGGGRASVGGPPLTRAGAADYAALLRSVPGTPPVFAAIGSGDASTDTGRSNFARRVVPSFRPKPGGVALAHEPVGLPADLAAPRGEDTVAYAFDIPGDGGSARVVVIDDPKRDGFRGTFDGPQARWLLAVLNDAQSQGIPAVVIGSTALDGGSSSNPIQDSLLDLLASGGAAAYVSTDGDDDPDSIHFGARLRDTTVTRNGHRIELIHSSALGHALPFPVQQRLYMRSDQDRLGEALRDASDPALVELTIPTSSGTSGSIAIGVKEVPVFDDFLPPDPIPLVLGQAGFAYANARVESDNGVRWLDADDPESGQQSTYGSGISSPTPDQCRLWESADRCGASLPSSARFTVADPDIAIMVRARSSGRGRSRIPEVILGADGNPVQDASSGLICALAAGKTTIRMTVSGRSTDIPLEVLPAGRNSGPAPAANGAPCSFDWRSTREPSPKPEPAKPTVPVPAPNPTPEPKPHAPVHHGSPHILYVPQPLVPLISPLGILPAVAPGSANPPIAPNPKPITTPTPAPPAGVSTQQVPAPNTAVSPTIASVRQEARRGEIAREESEHSATIYHAAPRPDVSTWLVGGALAILLSGGGYLAGRRRALASAARRAFLR